MTQLIIAALLRMRNKFPELKVWDKLLKGYTKDVNSSESWVKKMGLLDLSMKELFDKMPAGMRAEIFIKVLKELYPKAVINKHSKAEAYLIKVPELEAFIYDVERRAITIKLFPTDRKYPDYEFFKQLPRVKDFFNYLDTYSKRRKYYQQDL